MQEVIVVVEPHADDAFLSMHQHMVDWIKEGNKVIIATVFSGTRKRARDAEAYATAIGAAWCGFGFVEGQDVSPLDANPFDSLPGMQGMLHQLGALKVISPLGIQHPEHKAVKTWLEVGLTSCSLPPPVYYVEIPYYSKLKNAPEVNELLKGAGFVSLKKAKHYKTDEKYWKCFKDQSKFFHFNPAEGLKEIVEMVVSK